MNSNVRFTVSIKFPKGRFYARNKTYKSVCVTDVRNQLRPKLKAAQCKYTFSFRILTVTLVLSYLNKMQMRLSHQLLVPRTHSSLKQRRAFSASGPSTWHELPPTLHLLPGTTCLLSASFFKTSLAVAGLVAPLSRFLKGALYKYPE